MAVSSSVVPDRGNSVLKLGLTLPLGSQARSGSACNLILFKTELSGTSSHKKLIYINPAASIGTELVLTVAQAFVQEKKSRLESALEFRPPGSQLKP